MSNKQTTMMVKEIARLLEESPSVQDTLRALNHNGDELSAFGDMLGLRIFRKAALVAINENKRDRARLLAKLQEEIYEQTGLPLGDDGSETVGIHVRLSEEGNLCFKQALAWDHRLVVACAKKKPRKPD